VALDAVQDEQFLWIKWSGFARRAALRTSTLHHKPASFVPTSCCTGAPVDRCTGGPENWTWFMMLNQMFMVKTQGNFRHSLGKGIGNTALPVYIETADHLAHRGSL